MDPKVLLVEDEPDLREALEEYLEACGFEVKTVESAHAAFEAAAAALPHIVMADLSLPDQRGDIFLEAFHRLYPAVLLYVHSGANFYPGPALLACGVTEDHVFTKPADLGEMAQRLHTHYQQSL